MALNKRQIAQNLLTLANLLRCYVTEGLYDHATYGNGEGCNTAHCALGWAGTYPQLFHGMNWKFCSGDIYTGFYEIGKNYGSVDPYYIASKVFGKDSYGAVFSYDAFGFGKALYVSKQKVIEQLEKMALDLGYVAA